MRFSRSAAAPRGTQMERAPSRVQALPVPPSHVTLPKAVPPGHPCERSPSPACDAGMLPPPRATKKRTWTSPVCRRLPVCAVSSCVESAARSGSSGACMRGCDRTIVCRQHATSGSEQTSSPFSSNPKWVSDGPFRHTRSHPKRVSRLAAYGTMCATSLPVLCGGVKATSSWAFPLHRPMGTIRHPVSRNVCKVASQTTPTRERGGTASLSRSSCFPLNPGVRRIGGVGEMPSRVLQAPREPELHQTTHADHDNRDCGGRVFRRKGRWCTGWGPVRITRCRRGVLR